MNNEEWKNFRDERIKKIRDGLLNSQEKQQEKAPQQEKHSKQERQQQEICRQKEKFLQKKAACKGF